MTALGFDAHGRFVRCARCEWLDDRASLRCVQCGLERAAPPLAPPPTIELRIERLTPEMHSRSVSEIAAIRDALVERSKPTLSPLARRAIVEHTGRLWLLASNDERWSAAAHEIFAAIAVMRGGLDAWSDEALERTPLVRAAKSLTNAQCAVVRRALSLSRSQRDALRSVRWVIVADPAPLARSLASLHELIAIARPEIARTRRAFTARFAGIDRAGSGADVASLGALLSRVALRVDEDAPLTGGVAQIERWLDAAPRG